VWLGATVKNLTGEAEKSAAGLGAERGVLFLAVPAGSAAAQRGFQAGDVLLEIAGSPVDSLADLRRLAREHKGQTVSVIVFNAVERELRMKLE
jgi:serine protease Do